MVIKTWRHRANRDRGRQNGVRRAQASRAPPREVVVRSPTRRQSGLEPPPSILVRAGEAALSTDSPPLMAPVWRVLKSNSRAASPIIEAWRATLAASARLTVAARADSASSSEESHGHLGRQLGAPQPQPRRRRGTQSACRPIGPLVMKAPLAKAILWSPPLLKRVPSPQSGQPCRTVGEVLVMVFLDRWA